MAKTKVDRQQVFDKCGGRCAYCGRPIEFNKFQVDHLKPLCHFGKGNWIDFKWVTCDEGDPNDIDNLMPACRKCNHYKRGDNLELFRSKMAGLHTRLAKIYILEVAVNFGMSSITPFDGKFYFEKINE